MTGNRLVAGDWLEGSGGRLGRLNWVSGSRLAGGFLLGWAPPEENFTGMFCQY